MCGSFSADVFSARATMRRASAFRPRDTSQRTDSGAINAISTAGISGMKPSAASPRQPMLCSMVAAVSEAVSTPSETGITVALVMMVRWRVGVYSTISGTAAEAAAPTPKPTTKRKPANMIQAPSGIRETEPAPSAQRAMPATSNRLRPKRSASAPHISEPIIAPTPALSSMMEVWPKVSCHCGASTATRKPTMK